MNTENDNLQNNADGQPIQNPENTENQPTATEQENLTTQEETPKVEATAEKDYDDAADHDQAHAEEDDHEEESEETAVPIKNYEEMSLENLVKEAESLLKNFPVTKLKHAFTEMREAVKSMVNELEKEAKDKFLAEGGNEIDFRFHNPHKSKFNDAYANYKGRLDEHYKKLEQDQKENLKQRWEIIEELKNLYQEPSNNNAQLFKTFRELKTKWHNAGRVPKADANDVFRTYYHHLDNFYKFLDLNQELRKMDYEHNLEVRKSIIERAEQLLKEPNVQKALNELQYLHRMWKEEAVPVAEEDREPTWQAFKDITSKIHDRKVELNEQLQQQQLENLAKKQEIIAQMNTLLGETAITKHNVWQKKIKEMNALREAFFAVGRVPKEQNQPTWDAFKEAARTFNRTKNEFYKQLKREQMENLEKKRALLAIAHEHKESTNWNESVKVFKKIQSDWKNIGHVPRKYSDKIWKEFNEAANYFFDRYKSRNSKQNEAYEENLAAKKALIAELKEAKAPKDQDELLEWLNEYRIRWSQIGFVPRSKVKINDEFNTVVANVLTKAGLDKDAIENAQWEADLKDIIAQKDERRLNDLKYHVRKQMDEVQKEVSHLQNNLSFFANADENNPLFKNAISNIENKVAELKSWENKLSDLRHIKWEEAPKEEDNTEEASEN